MQHENQMKASAVNRPDFGSGFEKEDRDFEWVDMDDLNFRDDAQTAEIDKSTPKLGLLHETGDQFDSRSNLLLPAVQQARAAAPEDDELPALSFDSPVEITDPAHSAGSNGSDFAQADSSEFDRIEPLRTVTLPHHDGLRLRMHEDALEACTDLPEIELRPTPGIGIGSVSVDESSHFNDELWWMLKASDPVRSGITSHMDGWEWQAENRIIDPPITGEVHASAYTATDDLWRWKIDDVRGWKIEEEDAMPSPEQDIVDAP